MKLKDLPSIKSLYTITSKALKDFIPNERIIYDGDNIELTNYTDKVVVIGIDGRKKIASDSFICRNPTVDEIVAGFVDGVQYHRVKYSEDTIVKIYGTNDFVLEAYERIDGLLNSNFSQELFDKFKVQFHPLNKEEHLPVEIGGKITRCLLSKYNMVYSTVKSIDQDGEVHFYLDFKINKIEIEE